MNLMKRCFCLFGSFLLLILLLCPVSYAVTDQALDVKIKEYMQTKGLNRNNFALSYINGDTGDVVNYNADAFLPAGNVWILPLHMYYYKMETTGELDKTLVFPDEEYLINGMTLKQCRYHSISLNEADVSEQMRDNLGDVRTYLELLNTEYTIYDPIDIPEEYWTGRNYSAKYISTCLAECNKHPEYYPQMLKSFQEVQTAEGFADYSDALHVYDTVKLRGEQDGWICEAARVSTTSPFVITVFIAPEITLPDGGTISGEAILVELRELISSYLEELEGIATDDTSGASSRDREDTSLIVITNPEARRVDFWKNFAVWIAGAAVLAGVISLIYYLLRRYHNRDYDDFG